MVFHPKIWSFAGTILCLTATTKLSRYHKKKGQFLGKSWMSKPSGKPRPGVRTMFPPLTVFHLNMRKIQLVRFCLFRAYKVERVEERLLYLLIYKSDKILPVFRNQVVNECCHQDLGEVGSNAEPKPASERHEMLRSTGDFRFVLFNKDQIRIQVSMWIFFLINITKWFILFLQCAAL